MSTLPPMNATTCSRHAQYSTRTYKLPSYISTLWGCVFIHSFTLRHVIWCLASIQYHYNELGYLYIGMDAPGLLYLWKA